METKLDSLSRMQTGRISICGIGQWFRGDDAVGLTIVQRWQQSRKPAAAIDVQLITAPASQLPDVIQNADFLLLVDAMTSGKEAGHLTVAEDIDELEERSMLPSSHGLGILEIVRMMKRLPNAGNKRIVFLGVEIKQTTLGEPISDELEKIIPEAMRMIDAVVGKILSQPA
jgi:hydrogenase maturation protease